MITRLLCLSLACAAPLAAQTAAAPTTAPVPVPLSPADSTRLFARGKQINDWFLAGMLDSVYAAASAETQQQMGGIEWLHSHWERFIDPAGAPVGEVTMALTRRGGEPQFWYEARFSQITNDLMVVRWVLDTDGRITGVGMGPKGTARKDS
ncbi:MAG TPA: hypothetical protein VFN90_02705 [Gemmatimonadales bacterium]|nr:hypothetical protein [Gemmatimonadales bacterium]